MGMQSHGIVGTVVAALQSPTPHKHKVDCHLMDTYSIVVQVVLAVLAFSTLLLKRWREQADDQRPLRIWFADTTKQAVGAGVIHVVNVAFSSTYATHDPCTWYLINFLLDTTVGLAIIYIVLLVSEKIAIRMKWDSLRSGEYGDPFQWSYWLKQCTVYLVAMAVEKIAVTGIVQAHFWIKVSEVILPIKNQQVRVVLVMLIVPFVVNVFMFWVVDNFLKRKRRKECPATHGRQNGSAKLSAPMAVRYSELKQLMTDDSDDAASAPAMGTSDTDIQSLAITRR